MRPPRFRLRTLLVAVAVAGLLLGCARDLGLAACHQMRVMRVGYTSMGLTCWVDSRGVPVTERRSAWHEAMRNTYLRAAALPWLPVPPDPPPPD